MARETLEQIYKQSESSGGNCPLPEPGHEGTSLEQPTLVSVRKQPERYDYDAEETNVEANLIKKEDEIWKLFTEKKITEEEAAKFLAALQN